MKHQDILSDEEVELEIVRLKSSDEVKLARAENAARTRRRQYMYQLRWLEKRGKALSEQGMTLENIEETIFGGDDDDC